MHVCESVRLCPKLLLLLWTSEQGLDGAVDHLIQMQRTKTCNRCIRIRVLIKTSTILRVAELETKVGYSSSQKSKMPNTATPTTISPTANFSRSTRM
ncbi:hypothetical protein EDB19DRAFT_1698321, partial [Suillus lakei]